MNRLLYRTKALQKVSVQIEALRNQAMVRIQSSVSILVAVLSAVHWMYLVSIICVVYIYHTIISRVIESGPVYI